MTKTRTNPVGMSPRSSAVVSKTKHEEKRSTKTVLFPRASHGFPGDRPTGEQMIANDTCIENIGMSMSQIKKEVFPKPTVSLHVHIQRTYGTRFYFAWKGPRKQVIFRRTSSICIGFVIKACQAQVYIQQGGFGSLLIPPSPAITSPFF